NEILNCIGNGNDAPVWNVQVEFRNSSLYHREVYALLREHGAGLVLHDMNTSFTPRNTMESDTMYVRFHGPDETFRGSYSDESLNKYADLITGWVNNKKRVYVYFNNTLGSAVHDLLRLNQMVNIK